MKYFILFFISVFLSTSCSDPVFTPKPRGYPKVVYPKKEYQKFAADYCHFTFEYPKYAVIEKDTSFFDEQPADPCWFNVYIPDFDCRLYCSYAPITGQASIDELKRDAFRMTEWHNKKATYIEDQPFRKANNVQGVLFEVEGPVASQVQFFLTDTLEQEHFLRCALYFNTQARPDSLAPVYQFVREDVDRMIASFSWNG
ncbi:MAG TPA: hypothetical protein ENJ95_05900 [Bacteroidetes bacterium]|nr:hypothetical protein [Bacteroidota bacterium]